MLNIVWQKIVWGFEISLRYVKREREREEEEVSSQLFILTQIIPFPQKL